MSQISYGHMILKRLSPSYLLSTFKFALSITGRAGHNVNCLYVPTVHLNYGKQIIMEQPAYLSHWDDLFK